MTKQNYAQVTCDQSDSLKDSASFDCTECHTAIIWQVCSAGTDDSTSVRTVVWERGDERIMDIRFLSENRYQPDVAPCEHYTWIEAEGQDD